MYPGHDWCSASMAERLVQLYTSLTFGDPLIGCLVASLLLPGCGGAVQLAVLHALVEASDTRLLRARTRLRSGSRHHARKRSL
jgi:hypothetical protein